MKLKSNTFIKDLFKVTITKKIVFFYLIILVLTVGLTSIISFFFFQKAIEDVMVNLDVNIEQIKIKLKEIYDEGNNKIWFHENYLSHNPKDVEDNNEKENNNPDLIIKDVVKEFSSYKFKIEAVDGIVEFEEKPKLIFDRSEGKYFFEVSRKIKFKESEPIKSLKLSIKAEFYKIILKSLFFGAFITLIILLPFIFLFSRTLVKPIVKISKGAKLITSGKLGIKVKKYSNDELGELAKTFNNMSRELHKIKRIRDDLLAVISHELRSPLGRIKGYTELIYDLNLNKKEKKLYFDSIFTEIDFVNYMIGEIIEISRLELNKEQLFLEKIDLAELINDIKNELELSNPLKEIQYTFHFYTGLYCNIDISKIKRVLVNVIENSKKAKATEVKVTAEKEENNIKIKIIDNGIGIPEDQLEIVFEKFYRVDKSRDRATGGFGLGLAICRGIINEHGGNIYFIKKEKGAELIIDLPINSNKINELN